jgi:hypothetical protein
VGHAEQPQSGGSLPLRIARTSVILLVDDLHVRIVSAATGELLRELITDPTRDYQPQHPKITKKPPNPQVLRFPTS